MKESNNTKAQGRYKANGSRNKSKKRPKQIRSKVPGNQQYDYASDTKGATKAINDISWYAKTPQLLRDAASLSFNNALGAVVQEFNTQYNVSGEVNVTLASTINRLPGIIRFRYAPVPGVANDYTSPVNLAAQNQYTFIRHANSGAKNYDAPDLMLYFMAINSIYNMINLGKRAYGLAMTYDQRNYYLPKGIVEAAGFDPKRL